MKINVQVVKLTSYNGLSWTHNGMHTPHYWASSFETEKVILMHWDGEFSATDQRIFSSKIYQQWISMQVTILYLGLSFVSINSNSDMCFTIFILVLLIMMLWHGNVFLIIGPLCRESIPPITGEFPSPRASSADLWHLMSAWKSCWTNSQVGGDLRCHDQLCNITEISI